ncbi:MAG: PorP/SprF family type IX secretion system membrane protein [Prevotellaceae bacterium]|nr:PorP/SprF family type IX secretion system membrane protein [Prevotellaceae bacterium]
MKFFNKYKSLSLGLLLCFVLNTSVWGQFDAQITQYMYNKTIMNPAAVGEQQMIEIFGLQRLQWISINNAPSTTFFSVHSPFSVGSTQHGGGIRFVNDEFGIFSNQQFSLQYAYKLKLGEGRLSIGTTIGFSNIVFSGDSVHLPKSDYFNLDKDPAIPTQKVSGMGLDLGLGIYYSTKDWYAGMSVLHLPETSIQLGDVGDFFTKRLYTVSGGYNFELKNPDYKLKTSALIITDLVSWNPNVSLLLDYKDKYWGGLSGRLDAVSFLLGMRILNGLMIGYSYDLPTTTIIAVSHGSHEICLGYEFNLAFDKKNKKYKSVRIL